MVVVSEFNIVFFSSETAGSFGSWKFIFACFLSISPTFRGRREARERALIEFCTVMLGKRVVVASTLVSSAKEKEAVKRRWLDEKREPLWSSVLVKGLPVSVPASSVTPERDPEDA